MFNNITSTYQGILRSCHLEGLFQLEFQLGCYCFSQKSDMKLLPFPHPEHINKAEYGKRSSKIRKLGSPTIRQACTEKAPELVHS